MPAIIFSLCFFFLTLFFSKFLLLCFSYPFISNSCSCNVVMWWLCCDTVTLIVIVVAVLMMLLCMTEAPYILPTMIGTISPFNHFCLDVGVLPNHPLVCQLPSHHHVPVLAVPHPITRQRILFCLLVHCGIPIRNRVGILSHYPSWHAPSGSNSSFYLLKVYHPSRTFPLKEF